MKPISEELAIAREHHLAGRLKAAEQIYRAILAVESNHPDAMHLLGAVAHAQGDHSLAVECITSAIRLDGTKASYHNNLGEAYRALGKLREAVACYQGALQLNPRFVEAYSNLGNALADQGSLDEAKDCLRRALQFGPDFAQAHNNLGNVLSAQGAAKEAAACYRRALALKPDMAEAWNNLGNAIFAAESLDDVILCFHRALQLRPDYAEAHNNLAVALKEQGKLEESIECCRRALQLKPGYRSAHSNLVYSLNFCPGYDPQTIYAEHRRWNQLHAEPLARSFRPHSNPRTPGRRLRIGYVSPDFRAHPVGRFILPLLEWHNRDEFEVLCYASVCAPDGVTDRCRKHADRWKNVLGCNDQELAEIVREDQVDVLVDLTMHMSNNRLLLFARKPAPLQVTYLAYCGTTGLSVMDYRLTDRYLDPPGETRRCYSEQSVWLSGPYWCYRPVAEAPAVTPPPVVRNGYITFGSLNNFSKVSVPALAAWCRLLGACPGSRLLLHARPGSHRTDVERHLTEEGVASERLSFIGLLPAGEYLQMYSQIDVALDPFPYAGGTTTCDALWMGVPVVTLAGRTAVGRSGLSILANLGLTELVAGHAEQYVTIATDLAQNQPRLAELRATLRGRMAASPLMNETGYARSVEAAYREMWRRWCAEQLRG